MLISNAYAQGAPAAGGGFEQIAIMVGLFAVFYFFLIRPQKKKAKEQKLMIDALTTGDEVITQGGIAGKITKVGENGYITIEIAENVEVLFQRASVGIALPKGSLKNL